MFKKRIGNDIQFTWHIYRKSGETQTPENFAGKDVEVKLISPLQRPVTIEDVSIATGVVTFTFRGKHQVTLGNYVAVLQENRGEDGMVTLDVVNAVTLVPHSYMEEDGDDGDVIEAASVELESSISAGGGGVSVDAYTKAESDEKFVHYGPNNKGVSFFGNDGSVIDYSYLHPNGVRVSASSKVDEASYSRFIDITADNINMASTRRDDPDEPVTRHTTVVWQDELDEALAGKQDLIQDLAAIRSGAQAGATAVQPADLTPIDDRLGVVEYCLGDYLKETYIFNALNKPQASTEPVYTTRALSTVINMHYCKCRLVAGGQQIDALWIGSLWNKDKIYFTKLGKATIYLVLNAEPHLALYDVIASICDNNNNVVRSIRVHELSYNSSRICTPITWDVEAGYYLKVDYDDFDDFSLWLGQIDFEITGSVKQISTDVHANSNAITAIEQKIPAQASSSNQLADKNFVNSSIATATATYRGSYNLVTDLSLTISATHVQIAAALATAIQTADNNDYCYVQIPVADATPTSIEAVERYKHNGTAWEYEYALNNSGYTAAQWAALNSGITSGLVAKLSALPTNSELTTLLNGKANTSDLAEVATNVATKQDKMLIVQVASGTTAINAAVNTYYEVAGEVGTLAITLPTPTDLTKVSMVVVHLTAGTTPNVVIGSTETIDFAAAYDISASKEYEINCLYNGGKWIVADMEVV